jgi:hypothetical protein
VTPAAYLEVARLLAAEPAGNVLAPWDLGNVIPAYGPHRVYVGHWFLTPDYTTRAQAYATLVNTPGREVDLMTLLSEERVRYLVTPAAAEERLTTALGVRVTRVLRVPGVAVIFVLGGTAG